MTVPSTAPSPLSVSRTHPRARLIRRGAVALTLSLGFAAVALPAHAATVSATTTAASATSTIAPFETAADQQAAAFDAPTEQARAADAAARDAIARAADVSDDATASELDLGDISRTIDVSGLRDALASLEQIDVTPQLLLPDLTEVVERETQAVTDAADKLSTALSDAEAEEQRRLEEERRRAEEEARLEAEREAAAEAEAQAQAEAEAAAEAESSESTGSVASAPSGATSESNSVAGAQATAQSIASSQYGWGADQFSCLVSLWNRESGWNYQAYNASSGATGIPQALPGSKMASAGSDWQTNATTQIIWGLGYISDVYGTPCGAWAQSEAVGWY